MNKLRKTRILALLALAVSLGALTGCGGDEAPAPAATPAAPAAAPAQPAAEPAAAAPTIPQTVPELLDAARLALREQRYVSPNGSNAIEFYLKVLELEPDNRQAQIAILDLMPQSQGSAEQMIESNRLDEAQAAVALLKRAQPTSVIVTSLEQRIVNQRRAEEQRLQAEEAAARTEERQAREQAAAQAQAAATPAPTTPPPSRATTAPATTPASSTPPPAAPAASAPTQVASNTPAPSVASQTAPQNKDFQLLKKVNASYPPQAIRARTQGWVELSFTITASGSVEDVEVVNANPRRIFDREAIRALSQWKFSPRIEGGKPVAAKARQRLEFTLN